jgi:biopolymer transport protein ExbB
MIPDGFASRAFLTVLGSIVLPASAWAQAAGGGEGGLNYNLIDLIKFGGWVGYIIIFLSVVAVALVVEYAMSLRTKALAPAGDVKELEKLISAGARDEIAAKLDGKDSSFLTIVVARGVKEHDRGYDAMVKAMEDAADELTGKLLRKIEHLNIIANIAPMLGLLGTVMGMVNSFNQISVSVGGVDPRRLAGGIFEALMTTVMGLIVAIPALYAFGIFRNRVDALVSDTTAKAEDLVEPLKRS